LTIQAAALRDICTAAGGGVVSVVAGERQAFEPVPGSR
jgi:hypothetical protein